VNVKQIHGNLIRHDIDGI